MLKWLVIFLLCFSSNSLALEYEMDATRSSISASVRYTVLGRYRAEFKEYDSALYFDEDNISNSFVEMTFQTKSLDSGMARFDRIVRSERLLDAKTYPEITFRSTMIKKEGTQYWVQGELDLHGVKRQMTFPFELEDLDEQTIRASGRWRIPRKAFGIIWHPVFDVGGLLVSNTILIDWEIIATH